MRRKPAHKRKELKAPIRFGVVQNAEDDLDGSTEERFCAEGVHAGREMSYCVQRQDFAKHILQRMAEACIGANAQQDLGVHRAHCFVCGWQNNS